MRVGGVAVKTVAGKQVGVGACSGDCGRHIGGGAGASKVAGLAVEGDANRTKLKALGVVIMSSHLFLQKLRMHICVPMYTRAHTHTHMGPRHAPCSAVLCHVCHGIHVGYSSAQPWAEKMKPRIQRKKRNRRPTSCAASMP